MSLQKDPLLLLQAPFRHCKLPWGFPRSFSFSGWTTPALSASSFRIGAPALQLSLGLQLALSSCPYVSGPGARHSMPGAVSPEHSRGVETFLDLLILLAFWAANAHCQITSILSSTNHSRSSPHGCFQSILCQAHICAWDCPSAAPCIWPCWTSWVLHRSTPQACQGHSGWHPFPPYRDLVPMCLVVAYCVTHIDM